MHLSYELSTQLDTFSPLARILAKVESLFSFVFLVCVGFDVKQCHSPCASFWVARVNMHFLNKCSLQVLIEMIMSSYAARMYVLKCFLLRNHSMQQKLQVLTVDIVKFLPYCSQRSQD